MIGYLFISTVVVVSTMIIGIGLLQAAGVLAPWQTTPDLKILKTKMENRDAERKGNRVVFMAPYPILLHAKAMTMEAEHRMVVDAGYHVSIPTGWCGILSPLTDKFKDGDGRPHEDVTAAAKILAPGYEGPIEIEMWNQSEDEPAGMNAELPFLELYLVPVPGIIRVREGL